MIQFNLLPDIKKEYIKVKRQKRVIMTVAIGLIAGSFIITGMMYSYVQVAQQSHIDNLTDDINSEIASINAIQDFNQILTIQNQLNALPILHEEKPEASRIFTYLNQLTPTTVRISSVEINYESETLTIGGTADSLAAINQYVDTIKFATYTTSDISGGVPFTDVLSRLNRSEDSASYEIQMTFDPFIFQNTVEVTLVVPSQVTTRSVTERPSLDSQENSLFENEASSDIENESAPISESEIQ